MLASPRGVIRETGAKNHKLHASLISVNRNSLQKHLCRILLCTVEATIVTMHALSQVISAGDCQTSPNR